MRRPGPCEPQRVAQTASCSTFPSVLNEFRRRNGHFEKTELPFGLLVLMLFCWRKRCRPESQLPFQRGEEKTNFSSPSLGHAHPRTGGGVRDTVSMSRPYRASSPEVRTAVRRGGGVRSLDTEDTRLFRACFVASCRNSYAEPFTHDSTAGEACDICTVMWRVVSAHFLSLMIICLFNPAPNKTSTAAAGSMSRFVPLEEIVVRKNINAGVCKLVYHSCMKELRTI